MNMFCGRLINFSPSRLRSVKMTTRKAKTYLCLNCIIIIIIIITLEGI